MLTVKLIIEKIYEKWSTAVSEKVGNNYGMKNSGTISKTPYASCVFNGIPGTNWDLDGDEGAVEPTIQIDIFTSGQKDVSQAYEIDEVSHKILGKLGFRRRSGPTPTWNIDPSITRITSVYYRTVGYGDSFPE